MRAKTVTGLAVVCVLFTRLALAQNAPVESTPPTEPTPPVPSTPPAHPTSPEVPAPPPEVKSDAKPDAAQAAKPPQFALDIHGRAYIWYYVPLTGGSPDLRLYYANLVLDAKYEVLVNGSKSIPLGFHVEPRFRDTKLRSFFPSNTWVQEVYGWVQPSDSIKIKVGKVYTRFGKFWDGSFYGNLPYFDGLKLSPDFGVSAEITARPKEKFRYDAYVQYFANDGVTNGSLPNRDTVSVADARKRHEMIFRAEPKYQINDTASVLLGLSAQYFRAELPAPLGNQNVERFGADLTVSPAKGLSIYGDYAYQLGRHVTDYPLMAASSRHSHYLLAGAEYVRGRFTGQFNYSHVNYSDLKNTESMIHPGVILKLHDHASLYFEYVYWTSTGGGTTTKLDHSGNVILNLSF